MEDKMKPVYFAYGVLEEGHTAPRHMCLSTDESMLNRYKNQSGKSFSRPDCTVLCDAETFQWIEDNQFDEVIVLTPENRDELKELHFYKEIVML